MKKLLGILMAFMTINIIGAEEKLPIVPMIPLLPAIPSQTIVDGTQTDGEVIKKPIETKTIIMGMEVEVVVPLEIISDVEVKAMVIDEQEIEVPFEIEVNKVPDKKDFYRLNFTETEIDIDDDGQDDTYIYSSKFINSKIEKDNKVIIKGKNISKEGYHKKIIYITVETHD